MFCQTRRGQPGKRRYRWLTPLLRGGRHPWPGNNLQDTQRPFPHIGKGMRDEWVQPGFRDRQFDHYAAARGDRYCLIPHQVIRGVPVSIGVAEDGSEGGSLP